MVLRCSIYSLTGLIGSVVITNRDLFDLQKDDKNCVICTRKILNDGYYAGNVQIQLRLIQLPDEEQVEELDENLFFYDPLSIPYDPNKTIDVPYSVKVSNIVLVDLIPLHTLATNSPAVQIVCNEFKERTVSWFRAGKNAEWKDLAMRFIVTSLKDIIEITAYSGKRTTGGSIILTASQLLDIPRDVNGIIFIYISILFI
jgi:hypothetical protein